VRAAVIVLFLGCSGFTAYDKITAESLQDSYAAPDENPTHFTTKKLGQLIQAVSRGEEGVVTTVSQRDPTLWFYSDRQVRPNIQHVAQLAVALQTGPYPLPYWYPQANGPRPRWFVVPQAHRIVFQELANRLDSLFSKREIDSFTVYQLY
jgi:hypothetical protein